MCLFNFLTVAQWGPRKNMDNTVCWFVEEFIDNPDVGLVVKTFKRGGSNMDRVATLSHLEKLLARYEDRKCKVYLLHGDLSDEEMNSLYKSSKIDALICLTHGEGFGLPLYEAAYQGLPIIAPNWSGHLDFLYMPVKKKNKAKEKLRARFAKVDVDISPVPDHAVWENVIQKDSMWCYPKQGSYKMKLRDVYKKYDIHKKNAKELQEWILNKFTPENQYKLMIEAVLGEEVVHVDAKDLPKVSIITSVYDGDEFIRPFLEDITRQTIFKEKCELILINANSPGNEEEVINEYLEKYPDNIVYKKLDEDPGIYGVWNIGVELSTGEYLTNANLDDRKAPNQLEKLSKALYLYEDIDLVYADMYMTQQPNETFINNSSGGVKYDFADFSLENLLRANMPHASPMWRKSLHKENGLFNPKYKSAGDWDMWLRSALNGSIYKKINDVLGLYYFNPKGISTNVENVGWKREEEKEIFLKYKKIYDEMLEKEKAGVVL